MNLLKFFYNLEPSEVLSAFMAPAIYDEGYERALTSFWREVRAAKLVLGLGDIAKFDPTLNGLEGKALMPRVNPACFVAAAAHPAPRGVSTPSHPVPPERLRS